MAILGKGLLPSDLTFGVELECIGDEARSFIELKEIEGWKIESDLSLDEEKGVEFISPKLGYNYFDLNKIESIMDLIKSFGFRVDESCGGHIHFGASYLSSLLKILYLISIIKYFEKELYAISNKEGNFIRSGCIKFASSITDLMRVIDLKIKKEYQKIDLSVIDSSILPKKDSLNPKSFSFNIGNVGDVNKNTVEFRMPNGTLEFEQLIENVFLCGSIVKFSSDSFDNPEMLEKTYGLLSVKKRGDKKIEILLDLLFGDNDELKKIYLKRYETNIKDPMLGNLGIKETTLNDYPTIKKVLEKTRKKVI